MEMVTLRFPKLNRIAKKQMRGTDNPMRIQQIIPRLSQANTAEEAEDILFSLDEEVEGI